MLDHRLSGCCERACRVHRGNGGDHYCHHGDLVATLVNPAAVVITAIIVVVSAVVVLVVAAVVIPVAVVVPTTIMATVSALTVV